MNRYSYLFLPVIIHIIFTSCATTDIKINIKHPPLIDMSDMKTITVIPLQWNGNRNKKYDYLSNDVSIALNTGILEANNLELIDPSILRNIDKSDYWKYTDIFIDAIILNVTMKSNTNKEKTTRTVKVNVLYKYIRAIDNKELGIFNKTEQSSITFGDSGILLLDLAVDIFAKGRSYEELAKSAIEKFASSMNNELNSYTTTEKRKIAKSTSKNPMFNEAKKFVEQKEYFEALILYKSIYEQTGSAVAGYNAALLLEENNQFTEALELLEKLNKGILVTGKNSPEFIKKEIEQLRFILSE
jgi:hypothetical protein